MWGFLYHPVETQEDGTKLQIFFQKVQELEIKIKNIMSLIEESNITQTNKEERRRENFFEHTHQIFYGDEGREGEGERKKGGLLGKLLSEGELMLQSLEVERKNFFGLVGEDVIGGLRDVLMFDVVNAKNQCIVYSKAFKHYNSCKIALESAERDKQLAPKQKEKIEDNFEKAKLELEQSDSYTVCTLNDCKIRCEIAVSNAMLSFMRSEEAYHKKCLEVLSKVKLEERLKKHIELKEARSFEIRSERKSKNPAHLRALQKQNEIFGVELAAVVQREKEKGEGGDIPKTIQKMADWLIKYGTKEVGVFRVSAGLKALAEWREKIDRGEQIENLFVSSSDPHLIACLLKQYLRQLPSPACPFSVYQSLIDFIKKGTKDVDELKKILVTFPPANFFLLREVARVLKEVSTNSFVNLMPVSNLAITIGPNILRRDNGLEEVKYVNEFVVFLVENFEGLFLPSKTFLFESIMAQDFQTVVGLMGVEEFDVNMIDEETNNSLVNILLDHPTPSSQILFEFAKKGADLNQPGGDGLTPIFRSIGEQAEKKACLLTLLNFGVDVEKKCVIYGKEKKFLDLAGEKFDQQFLSEVETTLTRSSSPSFPLLIPLASAASSASSSSSSFPIPIPLSSAPSRSIPPPLPSTTPLSPAAFRPTAPLPPSAASSSSPSSPNPSPSLSRTPSFLDEATQIIQNLID